MFPALAILLFFAGNAAGAEHPRGRVVHVVDGYTVDVLVGEKRVRMRLAGIDAPDQKQMPYGLRSRQSLISICGGDLATVEAKGKDRNGRTRARVSCNGTDAGAEQVRRGMAWVIDRNDPADAQLEAAQHEARAAGRGLWSERQPVASGEPRKR